MYPSRVSSKIAKHNLTDYIIGSGNRANKALLATRLFTFFVF